MLDLTCGLGVDARALAMRFREVVTLERNEVLAELTRENFRRLGINNVTVLTTDAESYVQHCTARFDWVYALNRICKACFEFVLYSFFFLI